jgi:hypothetical protein
VTDHDTGPWDDARPTGRPPRPGIPPLPPAGARPPLPGAEAAVPDSGPAGSAHLPPVPGQPPAPGGPRPPARPAGWVDAREARGDLRDARRTAAVLALTGLPAALLWLWLAPRATFRVVEGTVEPIGAPPSNELFMADDGVYVLVLAGLGLLTGLAVWSRRRTRGVVALAALAAGMTAASLVAWQVGELLGRGPSDEQLSDVGATVTSGLELGAVAAVTVAPFVAVLTYLVASTFAARDDLGRDDEPHDGAERWDDGRRGAPQAVEAAPDAFEPESARG